MLPYVGMARRIIMAEDDVQTLDISPGDEFYASEDS